MLARRTGTRLSSVKSITMIRVTKQTESGKPSIRDTGFTVWEVYLKLAMAGMPEEQVFGEHPGLISEDLVAVREFIVAEIKSRTHDEYTGRPVLAKEHLRDGAYYKGRCRNATVARWNAGEQCFYHWRERFEDVYIETIKYPTGETE